MTIKRKTLKSSIATSCVLSSESGRNEQHKVVISATWRIMEVVAFTVKQPPLEMKMFMSDFIPVTFSEVYRLSSSLWQILLSFHESYHSSNQLKMHCYNMHISYASYKHFCSICVILRSHHMFMSQTASKPETTVQDWVSTFVRVKQLDILNKILAISICFFLFFCDRTRYLKPKYNLFLLP